jgi:hypothetical protein
MKRFFFAFAIAIFMILNASASDIARNTNWYTQEELTIPFLRDLSHGKYQWELLEWGWIKSDGYGPGNDMRNSGQIWYLRGNILAQWKTGEGDFIYKGVVNGNKLMLEPKYKMIDGGFGPQVGTSDEVMMLLGINGDASKILLVDGNGVYRVFAITSAE